MPDQVIQSFTGVDIKTESTEDAPEPMPLRRAEGVLLNPSGAIARPPPYSRVWGLENFAQYIAPLGLLPEDKTVCVLVRNEGIMFLVFYDVTNMQSMGSLYCGLDPESTYDGPLTLTAAVTTENMQVLWKGLANQYRWSGSRSAVSVTMGNGYDPNLLLETTSPVTMRPLNDQLRPLAPVVAMIDAIDTIHQDATLQAGNVLFTALEAQYQPLEDAPYRRDRGNKVQISVVQSGYDYFSSSMTGLGTLIDPFVYQVLCPETLPTEDELVNYINKDANAQGVVSAQLVGSPETVTIFPPAFCTGGVAQFAAADAFAGPFVAACLTYCRKGSQPNTFSETMPSPVVTCQMSAAGRVAVTVVPDNTPYISRYATIRIYIGDLASAAFGLSVESYGQFFLGLEVPNEAGTYIISPAMLNPAAPTALSVEARTPPPCSEFIYDQDQGRLVLSGNADFPMRAWFLKAATSTDRAPEGLGIYNFIDFPSNVFQDKVTGLGYYRGQTVVYTKRGAFPFDSTDTTKRFAVSTGAINSRLIKTWENGSQYFLGRDYNIYTLTQPVTDAKSDVPDFNLPLPQVGNYLQQFCDLTDFSFAHSVVDALNKLWWIWLRTPAGSMAGFVVNFETNQLTGPFNYPQLMCAEFLDDGDTRMVGMDIAGNMFFMDVKSVASVSEPFNNATGLTLHPATDSPGSGNDGFGVAMVTIGGRQLYIKKANLIRLQSPWLNFGDAASMKTFLSFSWQMIQNSAGLVWIVVINEKGQSVTRFYGEVYGRRLPPRVLLRLKGNLLQFMVLAVVGDDLPFAIRNVTLEYTSLSHI